jgi:hypothetical protein
VPIDQATGQAMPQYARSKLKLDGYWRPASDLHGTRVSAVLFGNTLSAYSAASRLPELWLNPWAPAPLAGLEPFQTVYVDDDNHLATREATAAAAAVFKLPPEWPNLA